jgi:hypothetical protein
MKRSSGAALVLPVAVAGFLLTASVFAKTAGAQSANTVSQLDGRASASLRAQVLNVADSVMRAGLPAGPLIDKTLEGISKGADDRRIMIAVRAIAGDLGVARRALGPSSDGELAAAVAALRAGSSPAGLTQLRRSLPDRPLVVPLSVLASLLVDGAPAPSALLAVVSTAKQRSDSDLLAYGRVVSRDIASGVAPLTAMSTALTSGFSAAMAYPTSGATIHPSSLPKPKPKPKP